MKTFKLILVLFILFFLKLQSIAQMHCEADGSQQLQSILPPNCDITSNYIPDPNHLDHRPIVYIKVNVHFMTDGNNQGNFNQFGDGHGNTYPTAYDYAELMIESANNHLANNEQMFLPVGNTTPVIQTQYRLELWDDPNDANDNSIYVWAVPPADFNYNTNNQNLSTMYSPHNGQVFDIYMKGNTPNTTDYGGRQSGSWIQMTNAWAAWGLGIATGGAWDNVPGAWGWWDFGGFTNHEIGHALASSGVLCHSFYGANVCSDIDPVAECNIGGGTGYCGTNGCNNWDSGSNNFMGYNGAHTAWTPCQLGIIHEYFNNTLPSYIDMEKLCTYDATKTVTIQTGENILWNSTRFLQGDINVEPGATLTITCKLGMASGSIIRVKPNAKLIVDGGWITNICGDIWNGIEVFGDVNYDQYIHAGVRHQGYVQLKNAEIEFALGGVALWESESGDASTAGGIVTASNTTFTNCWKAAEFMKYENSLNGTPHSNLSSFTLCTFKVDDNFPLFSGFDAHVTMWDVTGIRFRGCKFLNNMSLTNPHITVPSDYGMGIRTMDASFSVTSYCSSMQPLGQPCPTADLTKSEFRNLFAGISTINAKNVKTFNVNEAYFQNCWDGIYTLKTDRFTIYNSTFDIGNNFVNNNQLHQTGINCINGTGWKIEENIFNRIGIQSLSDGVVITNSGTTSNKVYRNTFNGLKDVGCYGVGNNYDWVSNGNNTGLQFTCNSFLNNCEIDIASNDHDASNTNIYNNSGIRISQGNFSFTSGNCLSSNSPLSQIDLFNANNCQHYNYFFSTGQACQVPQTWTQNLVIPFSAEEPNTCLTNLAPYHGHFKTPVQLTQVAGVFNIEKANYLNLKQTYLLLIDGGNTEQLRDEVFFSVPSESWQLYNSILPHSPNVSLEVALEAINREDVLPNSMIFELLYANPDLLREERIFIALINKIDPMPEYLIYLLRIQANETTLRTELESQISSSCEKAQEAANEIVLHYMNDTTAYETDSINLWLANMNTIESYYSAMKLMLQIGDYENANILLSNINNFGWNELTIPENERIQEYNSLLINWLENGKQLNNLDSNDVAQLVYYAESGYDNTAVESQGILNFFYGFNYYIPVPDINLVEPRIEKSNAFATIQKKIKLYPNPAQDYVTVEWNIFEMKNGGLFTIKNAKDQVVYSKTVTGKSGHLLINTEDLVSGLYLVSINYNGLTVPVDKLTVIK